MQNEYEAPPAATPGQKRAFLVGATVFTLSQAVSGAACLPAAAQTLEERREARARARRGQTSGTTQTESPHSLGDILSAGFTKPVPLGIFLAVVFALYIIMMLVTRAAAKSPTASPPDAARWAAWSFLTLLLLYVALIHFGLVVHPALPLLYLLSIFVFVLLFGIILWATRPHAARA